MTLHFVESHPTFRLTYSLDGPLLTCLYSSWLRGSAETTIDLRVVSPRLSRASVRDPLMTRCFYLGGLFAFCIGLLSLDHLATLLGHRERGLLVVGGVAVPLLMAVVLHPFRRELVRVVSRDGQPLLDLRRPRRPSSDFDRLLEGITAALPAGD